MELTFNLGSQVLGRRGLAHQLFKEVIIGGRPPVYYASVLGAKREKEI